MTYVSEVLADSPLLYWRLGESSGTVAADASGNGLTGTYSGGYTLGTTGLLTGDSNTAVTFNGSTGLVTGADTTDLTAFTVEAWVKPASGSSGGIAGRDSATSSNRIFYLGMNGNKPEIVVFKNGSTFTSVLGPTAINDNVRHHLVGTYDGTTVRLYVDGTQVGTPSTAISGALPTANTNFVVGGRATFGEFNSVIDEISYYSTALNSTRVAAHYTAGTTTPTPITIHPNKITSTGTVRAPAIVPYVAPVDGNLNVTAELAPARWSAAATQPNRSAEVQPARLTAGVKP